MGLHSQITCGFSVFLPGPQVGQFYEDLQELLELTPKEDVLFITGDWNAKVGSQEIPEVTGKFGFGVHKKSVKG